MTRPFTIAELLIAVATSAVGALTVAGSLMPGDAGTSSAVPDATLPAGICGIVLAGVVALVSRRFG